MDAARRCRSARAHTARRLFALAAPFLSRFALAVLLGVATVGSSIGLMASSGYLLARAALHPSIAELQVAIVGVRFFGIARGLARYLERVVSHDVTFRLLAHLRAWFYRALEPLAPARLLSYRSGDLLTRIGSDVDTLQDFFLRALAPPAVALLVAIVATILLGSLDPRLATALAGFMLLTGMGVPWLTWAAGRGAGRAEVSDRSELKSVLVEGIQGVADLLAFGSERRFLERVRGLSQSLIRLQGRMALVAGLGSALTGLMMNLATLTVLTVAISLVDAGSLDGVYLALLVLAVVASFEAVAPLAPAFQYLGGCVEAAGRLFEIVDAQPAVVDPPSSALVPPHVGLGLRVESLRFVYGRGERATLDGIAFDLPPGGKLAVVGPSGAGKSTLAQVLLRFWDYDEGSIVLAGRELREYAQEDWRRHVGVVSQNTHLFNATVRDNLLLARPEASEADVIQAAQRAQIDALIQTLPHGYDTHVGELGKRISAGERQRLALARALLKDAPFLILDEPAANLDPVTERALLRSLWTFAEGRTTLMITHRLVGLEAVDQILVLDAGKIVERGRHEELVQRGGLYHSMWLLQTRLLHDTRPLSGAQATSRT